MPEYQLTVAVVGDPHFFVEPSSGSDSQISHVKLSPNGDFIDSAPPNPWLALKQYVTENGIRAELLLCAGDITVYAEKVGLERAWKELLDLGLLMGCSHVVSATGNHDIQSRSTADVVSKNAVRGLSQVVGIFERLKQLSPAYPIVEIASTGVVERRDLRTAYFGDDIAVLDQPNYRLAVLNSCCEHTAEPHQNERGSFPKSAQVALEAALASMTDPKINLMDCHHPPGLHGEHDLGDYDFIANGDGLVRSLERHGPWVIVHGHKHHGRISYAQGSNAAPVVFSASSLGFCLNVQKSGMRNQFYCMNITMKPNGSLRGNVNAWDWHVGLGWDKATPERGGIYDGCGFGLRRPLEDIADEVAGIASRLPCAWPDVLAAMPDLHFLTPDDMAILAGRLANHKIAIDLCDDGSWNELVRANT